MRAPRSFGWRLGVGTLLIALWLAALYAVKVGVPFGVRLSPSGVSPEQGFAYIADIRSPRPLSALFHRTTDGIGQPLASTAQLFEDARPLGPKHSMHSVIRATGQGGFSDWQGQLYFSSSDNTDPKNNGRIYKLQDRAYLHPKIYRQVAWIAGLGLVGLWLQNFLFGQAAVARGGPGLAVVTQPNARRALNFTGVLTLLAVTCAVVSSFLSGVPFWIAAFLCLLFGLLGLRQVLLLAGLMRGASWTLAWLLNVALTVTSVGICVVAFEGYLAWLELAAVRGQRPEVKRVSSNSPVLPEKVRVKEPDTPGSSTDSATRPASLRLPPEVIEEITRRKRLLSLPVEWERKPIEVAGATRASLWHGVIHVFDDNNFRRLNGSYPKKPAGVMRVMVVGDSMTYGDGIREEWTYTAQLARAMRKEYRIEFFNLGADGYQSEDVAKVIESMLPELEPDLVIYGVCTNDFLPSGVGQYKREYRFPLPEELKQLLLTRTRVARFLSDNYQSVLIQLGLSMDFYDDILKDFKGYQGRFGADVKRMNNFVRSHGLPPILGMTLDQFVQVGGRGYRISRIAEELMREAGFDVISMEDYYKRYDGSNFAVSRWEGHPDEEANMLFASMLYENLSRRPDVQRFVLKSAGPGRLQAVDARASP